MADVTINVSICFHANVVFVQPTDISSHGESGNVNVLSAHFKKTTWDNSFIKRPLEMEANLEPKRAFSSLYKRDESCVGEFRESIASLTSIPVMLGRAIFSQFWSIFCNDQPLDFKCDIQSLVCNKRGFLRIIVHILIKIDLYLISVGAQHRPSQACSQIQSILPAVASTSRMHCTSFGFSKQFQTNE